MSIAAFSLFSGGLTGCGGPTAAPDFPHENAVYIWQRVWNDEVRAGLMEAPEHAGHLMVLAAEAETAPIAVDWAALAASDRPITLVLRYPRMAGGTRHTERVRDDMRRVRSAAEAGGVHAAGIQLDFDSPTRRLPEYAALLKTLRTELPETLALSITALPTWLDSPDFLALVAEVDYYVLQVHSFERPDSIESPIVLCDPSKIPAYTEMASAAGIPYYIAFPTHGYAAIYTREGDFTGLVAEEAGTLHVPPGHQAREVRADPAAIAESVGMLRDNPPPWYLGNTWFRMPVATDTRNWNWATLAAAMEGRAPTVAYKVEIRYPDPGLTEIWLTAQGEDRPPEPVTMTLTVPQQSVLAFDSVNEFTTAHGPSAGEVVLHGPAPTGNEPILAAWFRMRDEEAAKAIIASYAGETP